jgi:hypothetical protein
VPTHPDQTINLGQVRNLSNGFQLILLVFSFLLLCRPSLLLSPLLLLLSLHKFLLLWPLLLPLLLHSALSLFLHLLLS